MQCPFCKEDILDGAIKCRHCGSALTQQPQPYTQSPPYHQQQPYGQHQTGIYAESSYTLIDWYKKVITNYATFSGRARRKEYWYFCLGNMIIGFVLGLIGAFLGELGLVLSLIFNVALIIPSLAVGVRRMHDSGKSGWWLLLPIVNLIFLLQDSMPGNNQYGPSTKYA